MTKKKYNIAVVGATGTVGGVILEILAQRDFPVAELHPVASERSAGETLLFNNKAKVVQDLAQFDFSQVDMAFFTAGGKVSKEYVPMATKEGCLVIDNTSEFRYDDDVPLIVPEINAHLLAKLPDKNIIANPNCSTIQMLLALQPIYDRVGIARINVATYQAVSGAGKSAINELAKQTTSMLNGVNANVEVFPKQIAFNVIPQIGEFQDNGYTREEMKMIWETQKIFNDADILVNPTAVRVPVFYAHSEAINIETREHIDIKEAAQLIGDAYGVILLEDDYPTPSLNAVTNDAVYVGRLREDLSHPNGINLWVVADNIRKGAALNAVQIAELVIKQKSAPFENRAPST